MARDYIEIEGCPCEEACVSVSKADDYLDKMKDECKRYRALLLKRFPDCEEYDIRIAVKFCDHDFGGYYELRISFDEDDDDSCTFAYFMESHLPDTWADSEVFPFLPKPKTGVLQSMLDANPQWAL